MRHWSDDVRLFSHAVAVNGNDPVAHNNLGASLLRRNSVYKAVWHFMRALEIKPDDERALTNLRTALTVNQNRAQAIEIVIGLAIERSDYDSDCDGDDPSKRRDTPQLAAGDLSITMLHAPSSGRTFVYGCTIANR